MASGRIKYNQFAFMSVRDVQCRLLTLDEVAELLALSRRTVELRVQAGEIPALQWSVLSGRMYVDPAVPLQPPKKRGVLRETFSDSERAQIIADGPDPESLLRDRCALRLLLGYGLRKNSLRLVQFRHFDHNRRQLTIFAKGGKVRALPIVEAAFWDDLDGTSSNGKRSRTSSCSRVAACARTATRPARSS
jgi:excisionase family DNA binding protein